MGTDTLHDQNGDWIAYRVDSRFVYSVNGTFVGWSLEDQPDVVVDRDGSYLADIVDNRLFRRTSPPYVSSGYVSDPGGASVPSFPGNVGYTSLPSAMEDVPKDLLPGA